MCVRKVFAHKTEKNLLNCPNTFKMIWIFSDDFQFSGLIPNCLRKDIHYAFFGNVVRGKSVLFRLVVRNSFVHFVWKVFAHRKLLPGKFWVYAPLRDSPFNDFNEHHKQGPKIGRPSFYYQLRQEL